MNDIVDQIVDKVMKSIANYGSTEQYDLLSEVCTMLGTKMEEVITSEYKEREGVE